MPTVRADEKHDDTPFTGAIVFCPVCCSTEDAESWGDNDLECTACTTVFSVHLVPAVVAEKSMVG